MTYLSAVVVEELYAGAFDNTSIKLLDTMYDIIESLGGLITSTVPYWEKLKFTEKKIEWNTLSCPR